MTSTYRPTTVTLTRTGSTTYEATNARGVALPIGRPDAFSPVELLLAAIAGCSAVDVDVVTSRRAEPEVFEVTATGTKSSEGGNHLEDVGLTFRLVFPAGPEGDQARARVDAALKASHERDCTVSRTVEAETPISFTVVR